MSKSKKQSNAVESVVEPSVSVVETPVNTTLEQIEKMTTEEVITLYGNKSNAIRGMAALGMKPGPISKKLAIRYQHARNVLQRPLKRVIKAERDANNEGKTSTEG